MSCCGSRFLCCDARSKVASLLETAIPLRPLLPKADMQVSLTAHFLNAEAGQPRRRSLNDGAREFGQGQSWLTCNDEVDRLRTFALLVGLDIIADPLPNQACSTAE